MLGLTYAQGYRLVVVEEWPLQFRRHWYTLMPEVRACRAAKRIDHFIATEGRE